jgi:hypothetical protein
VAGHLPNPSSRQRSAGLLRPQQACVGQLSAVSLSAEQTHCLFRNSCKAYRGFWRMHSAGGESRY